MYVVLVRKGVFTIRKESSGVDDRLSRGLLGVGTDDNDRVLVSNGLEEIQQLDRGNGDRICLR